MYGASTPSSCCLPAAKDDNTAENQSNLLGPSLINSKSGLLHKSENWTISRSHFFVSCCS